MASQKLTEAFQNAQMNCRQALENAVTERANNKLSDSTLSKLSECTDEGYKKIRDIQISTLDKVPDITRKELHDQYEQFVKHIEEIIVKLGSIKAAVTDLAIKFDTSKVENLEDVKNMLEETI